MIKNILDASAVLAVLNGEPGQKKAIPLLTKSAISSVNLNFGVGRDAIETPDQAVWLVFGR